jgi:phosphoenolpyruvate carboxylase
MTPYRDCTDGGFESAGPTQHLEPRRDGRDSASDKALRREISRLGRLFGAVIRRFAGESNYNLVERVRRLSAELRAGGASAADELNRLLAELDESQLKVVIRSFTLFLELANIAEDRHRIRVLRERDLKDRPRSESILAAIAELREKESPPHQVQHLIDCVNIELVLTAHPTEAKRRSIRRLLRQIQEALAHGDSSMENREDRVRARHRLVGLLEVLWHTDLIRTRRPTVLQEVERGLAFLPILWDRAPAIANDLRRALHLYYPSVQLGARPLIDFGSWIGGDRDGNPFVTSDITEETLILLRRHAIEAHRQTCHGLMQLLSVSDRQTVAYPPLQAAIRRAVTNYAELAQQIESTPPLETYRCWLKVIDWKLASTANINLGSSSGEQAGAYETPEELLADVQLLGNALRDAGCHHFLEVEVEPWFDQIRVFGFHSMRLDIRQHAVVHRDALNEIWTKIGLHQAPEYLGEPDRLNLLLQSMNSTLPSDSQWSTTTAETLALFKLLRRVGQRFGMDALGEHVISMTAHASDILSVLVLWKWSETSDENQTDGKDLRLPIAPLFEKIDDLKQSASTLRAILENAAYRAHLEGLGNRQMVMIGYSDSTKDGGYLAAQWALYRAQVELQRVAEQYGVTLTFFHGRGGSLGRGGGPAARSVLSLPREAFTGSLRLTEQGEVLAERYDNPQIASRHLEQLVWSVITATARHPEPIPPDLTDLMERLATEAWTAYRALVEHPAFGEYYRAVTPITIVERLPMGSRPAKRHASNRIEDLRAIPWVFSWTQNRCLLPAWYGIGAAYQGAVSNDSGAKATIASAYQQWPFFTCAIDNAALALAKANMAVFQQYCRLAPSLSSADLISSMIVEEFNRSRDAVLEITGCGDLLDDVPWLQQSIRLRNGYVDPLNLIQVELMKRMGRLAASHDSTYATDVEHLANLSVKGISTGMRTTG